MIIAALAILGLILGSFVNALVWRFHEQAELAENGPKKGKPTKTELSMLKGRSMCSNCHHELAVKDLVPLFSWLWLKGKCRYCHKRIMDSPLIELILPLLFIISYLAWSQPLTGGGLYLFSFWLIFLTGFMTLAAYDLRWYLLPNRIVFPLIGIALLQLAGQIILYGSGLQEVIGIVASVSISSGIFYALYVFSQGRWIGGGDVKLGIVLGILLANPLQAMLMLFIASLLGTLVALPQLLTGKAGRTSKIPFGPYLMAATFIVVLYGQQVIDGYYSLLGLA